MLHIRPVSEKDASKKVLDVYADIKKTLDTHFVPLVFQYVAGFEEYFLYSWDKIKTNLESEYYQKATKEIVHAARKSIESTYRESRAMQSFLHSANAAEKHELAATAEELELLNAKLLILTIGLREGVKGVSIGQQILPKNIESDYAETVFDQFINQKIMHNNLKDQKELLPGAKMLAPIFGEQSLAISRYPEFFSKIAEEMENVTKTEKYLHERVLMEHKALQVATNLPYPLGCSYAEIVIFAGKMPYFGELLYVLSDTFPTKFPRLTFTTALMHQVLH